jgi:hypothetical protein
MHIPTGSTTTTITKKALTRENSEIEEEACAGIAVCSGIVYD